MEDKIIFFNSTIVDPQNFGKETSNQKGKEENKMEYVEKYYD